MNTNNARKYYLGVTDDPSTWGKFKTKEEADAYVDAYFEQVYRAKAMAALVLCALAGVAYGIYLLVR